MGDRRAPIDRFSSLPDGIALDILHRAGLSVLDAFLIGDVARVWTHYSEVEFDRSLSSFFRHWREKLNDEQLARVRKRLFNTIYMVLLGLKTDRIRKFTLSVVDLRDYLERNSEINKIFLFLSKKEVQEVTIEIADFFQLPLSLFTCLELRRLRVSDCMIPELPVFTTKAFKCLIDLTLHHVGQDGELLGRFISQCPILQRLSLCLCYPNDLGAINTPCLEAFELRCNWALISFVNASRLSRVSLFSEDLLTTPRNFVGIRNPVEFFRSMPALQVLRLDGYFLRLLRCSPEIGQILSNEIALKRVRLSNVFFHYFSHVFAVIFLVTKCRQLKEFKIIRNRWNRSLEDRYDDDDDDKPMIERYLLGKEEQLQNIIVPKLEKVKLWDHGDSEAEHLLLRIFLFRSPQLKTIKIGCFYDLWELVYNNLGDRLTSEWYVDDRFIPRGSHYVPWVEVPQDDEEEDKGYDSQEDDEEVVDKGYVSQDEDEDKGYDSEGEDEEEEVEEERRYIYIKLTRRGYH